MESNTVKELRVIAKSLGLKVSGRKAELIERINFKKVSKSPKKVSKSPRKRSIKKSRSSRTRTSSPRKRSIKKSLSSRTRTSSPRKRSIKKSCSSRTRTRSPRKRSIKKSRSSRTRTSSPSKEKGKVYIAAMNLRGKRAPKTPGSLVLNVTSAQRKASPERIGFSPMSEIPGGYKGFWCFENYWQSGKVYESIPFEKSRNWWLNLDEPRRKYPGGKRKRVLYSFFNQVKRDYVTSRKEIYVPEYTKLIKDREILKKWKDLVNSGVSVTVYDFDGPRSSSGEPLIEEVNLNFLREKIEDPKYPFGHGYVVAALLKGISPKKYT